MPRFRDSRCGICHTPKCRSIAEYFGMQIAAPLVYSAPAPSEARRRPWRNLRPRSRANSLKGIAIFAALPPDAIERIEQRCAWKRYAPGEPIVGYLDGSDDVFFIALGEVRVTFYSTAGKAVSFRELGTGEIFGEFPAIDGGPRSASVEARTNCLIASMPGSTFRELLQSEPGLAQALLPRMVKTIRALTTRIYEFSTLAVNNRIHA
ncbi:MAG: Crp/Fnr family transcriptional regulator, partial [Methyloceanibacter sp.]